MTPGDVASVRVGLEALRVNPLRTILSTLGVIMGVGSMVSVLSMSDGVEVFMREQIARTTDLLAVTLSASTGRRLDGVFVPRNDVVDFTLADVSALRTALPGAADVSALATGASVAQRDSASERRGVRVAGGLASFASMRKVVLQDGAFFTDADVAAEHDVVVLNAATAVALAGGATPASLLGRAVLLNGRPLTVVGIAAAKPREAMEAWVPLGVAPKVMIRLAQLGRPVQLVATARRVEEVEATQQGAERWLASRFGAEWKDKVDVGSNVERVKQATQTFQVFKILIAAITGVSLLVGGIGIMNVLLASVAERTREIGIRKATGARNRDVMLQFLSESVAITSAGATVGVLLGFAIAFTAAWVMRLQTKAPVHAAVTPATVLFAAFASIAVGLSFGLYPALRASRLSPIDAIRHE